MHTQDESSWRSLVEFQAVLVPLMARLEGHSGSRYTPRADHHTHSAERAPEDVQPPEGESETRAAATVHGSAWSAGRACRPSQTYMR